MSCICINIQLHSPLNSEELTFYNAENWTKDSESELFLKLHEVIASIRPFASSIQLQLNVEVFDYGSATTAVHRKASKKVTIKNQKLSTREIEILSMIMQGNTNQEIAEKLFISYETVRSHRKNILEKTGAKNTAALITYYHQTFFDK